MLKRKPAKGSNRAHDSLLESYTYNRLQNTNSIRLLELGSGTEDQTITCQLVTVDLTAAPPYETVSYMWGDPSDKTSILCEGCILSVPSSLGVTLKRFRHPLQIRVLWADAICINQDDLIEKNLQVGLMGSIYRGASRVLAWLGNDDGNSCAAFELIHQVESWMRDNWDGESLLTVPQASTQDSIWSNKAAWKAFAYFSDCRYFKRAWIQQEVGLGEIVTMYWGEHDISWGAIGHMVRFLRSNYLTVDSLLGHDSVKHTFVNTYVLYSNHHQIVRSHSPSPSQINEARPAPFINDFWMVLDIARGLQVSDSRDVVYAFLGHPTAQRGYGSTVVKADYSKTAEELYKEIAIKGLIKDKNSRVLTAVGHTSPPVRGYPPSWIPALSKAAVAPSFHGRYKAGSSVPMDVALSDCSNVISIKGFVLDNVSKHTDALRRGIKVLDATHQIIEIIKHVNTHASSNPYWGVDLIPGHLLSPEFYLDKYGNGLVKFYDHSPHFTLITPEVEELCEPFNKPHTKTASHSFFKNPLAFCNNRKVFRTPSGYIGSGPHILESGDLVCILFGADMPFILRREEEHHVLIGAAFVFGLMNGEAMKGFLEGRYKAETFEIH